MTEAKPKKEPTAKTLKPRPFRRAAQPAVKLPEWVIGSYDGPPDPDMSSREGFRR